MTYADPTPAAARYPRPGAVDGTDPTAVGRAYALVDTTMDALQDKDDPHAATRRAATYLAPMLRDSTLASLPNLKPPAGWQPLIQAGGYRTTEVLLSHMDGAPSDTPVEAHRAYIITSHDVGTQGDSLHTSLWLDLRRTSPTQPWTVSQVRNA